MTESEWLECRKPWKLLHFLLDSPDGPPSDRKLRLFTCAVCRRLWHLLTDPRGRKAVEVAERFVAGKATAKQLTAAHAAARAAARWAAETQGEAGYHAAQAVVYLTCQTGGGNGP